MLSPINRERRPGCFSNIIMNHGGAKLMGSKDMVSHKVKDMLLIFIQSQVIDCNVPSIRFMNLVGNIDPRCVDCKNWRPFLNSWRLSAVLRKNKTILLNFCKKITFEKMMKLRNGKIRNLSKNIEFTKDRICNIIIYSDLG